MLVKITGSCDCFFNIGLAQFVAYTKSLTYICWKQLKRCQILQYQPSSSPDCPQTLAPQAVLIIEPLLFHSVLRIFDSTWMLAIDVFISLGLFNEFALSNSDLHLVLLVHDTVLRITMTSLNTFFQVSNFNQFYSCLNFFGLVFLGLKLLHCLPGYCKSHWKVFIVLIKYLTAKIFKYISKP